MKMKRFISFVLTLVLLFGMFPLNETAASDVIKTFSIMSSAFESENKTSTNYRYDDLFNEKTLPTYMDFASYYASSYNSVIPGLENTNILGNKCDTMVPQAVCFAGDYMLITAYDGKEKYEEDANLCIDRDKYNSVIYVFSNFEPQSRSYLTTLVLPCKEHVGGLAFDGTNVWISNGNNKISSISYTTVQNVVAQNEDSVAIEFNKTVNIDIKPSFMTYYDGCLWVGTHEEKEKGDFNAYDISMLNDSETAVPRFYSHIPSKAQGALFVKFEDEPYLLLTRSLGRNTDKDGYISQIEFYNPDLSSSYVNINKPQKTLLAPPMIEGIATDGDYIYCCFESASTIYSTIEGNLCDTPVDRICALDTLMLFSYLEDYETNFDVKYTDLFYGYPYYLSNDIEDTYSDMIIEQYTSVLDSYNGADTFLAALRTGNDQGIDIYIKAIGSALGLTDSFYYECLDKATLELMKTIYDNEIDFSKYVSSIDKGYKNIKEFVDSGNLLTTKFICTQLKNLTQSQIDEIFNIFDKKSDLVFDMVDEGMDLWKITATACFVEDIKLEYINCLINALPTSSLLYEGLTRLKNDIYKTKFGVYIGEQYFTNKGIEIISKWIMDNHIWKNEKLSVSKALAKLVFKGMDWVIFEKIIPLGSGEDVIIDSILSTYVTELETAIMSQKLKFYGCFYSSEIFIYQVLYLTYISAMKTTLQYSEKLAKDSTQETNLSNAYNSVCNNYTYENYIRLCKNSVINTPYDDRIFIGTDKTYSTNDGTITIKQASEELEEIGKCIYLFENKVMGSMLFNQYDMTFDIDLEICGDVSVQSANVTITDNVEISINGDAYKAYNKYNAYGFNVNGRLNILGNFICDDCGHRVNMENKNSYLYIQGDFKLNNSSSLEGVFPLHSNGTVEVKGDVIGYSIWEDWDNTLILSGDKKQILSGVSFNNLYLLNTSGESVDIYEANGRITVSGEYHSPYKSPNLCDSQIKVRAENLFSNHYYNKVFVLGTFPKDIVINGTVEQEFEDMYIPENVHVKINGDFIKYTETDSSAWSFGLYIYGELEVTGNFNEYEGALRLHMGEKSKLLVHGNLSLNGYEEVYWTFDSDGIVEVKGNVTGYDAYGTQNTLILSGDKPQTISADDLQNVYFLNTSEEGITLEKDVKIHGEYHSPIKAVNLNGHKTTVNPNGLASNSYYGTVYFDQNVGENIIDKNVIVNANIIINYKKLTIEENTDVTINGSLTKIYTGSGSAYGLNINGRLNVIDSFICNDCAHRVHMGNEDSYLYVEDDLKLNNGQQSIWTFDSKGIVEVQGNVTGYCVSTTNSTNTLILTGHQEQNVSGTVFNSIINENTSDEGIVFTSTVKVNTLFNHNGKPFTLYNNGSGSTFVDYDGDGMKDNVDPEPTVGNPCTITVTTENSEKGTVSETIDTVGGTTVTVSAEPTFKYNFNCWKDANGNVVSYDVNYSFVAKSDTTLTAYFTKRQRNITTSVENGTLTVASKAEIESIVTINPVANEGCVYTENSITVNGAAIEGNTFVMPDEDVVLNAEFVRNDYYFALKDALTTATAIDQTMYSAETTNALKIAITNAQNSLVNNITQEESDARISELQSAINQLSPRYIVSISTDLTDVLVVMQNAETPLSTVVVSANYDNGTSVVIANYKVTGLDVSTLGVQAVTLSYQGFTTGISVRVTTQAILDVEAQIAELPETITLEQEEQVNTVKTVFDALSDEEKENIQNADVLFEAIETIETIYEDMDAAAIFDENVLAIAEMDGDVSNLVVAAMEEYASFTEQRKSYVTQYELLQKLNSAIPATQYFDSGLGVEQNPFVITTAIQLDMVREYPSLCYILGNDIDLSNFADWAPIDSFSGTLDGNGYIIKNLTSSQGGLIDKLTGTLNEIQLKNVDINVSFIATNDSALSMLSRSIGSLVNLMTSDAQVLYCNAEGKLSSEIVTYIGGLVGESSSGRIAYSFSNMDITVNSSIGFNEDQCIGGLIGYYSLGSFGGTKFYDNYSLGSITTNNEYAYVGGLVGYVKTSLFISSSIKNCFAHINFGGNGINSGFVGYLSSNKWKYSNCYYVATGNVASSCGNYNIETATICTIEQLESGKIAYALQSSREEMVWGQNTILMQPFLTSNSDYQVYKISFQNDSLVLNEQYCFEGKELYIPNVTPLKTKNLETDPIEYYAETDYKFIGWYDENGVEFDLNYKPTSDMVFNATFEALKVIPNDTSALVIDNENGIIFGITVIDNYVNMLEENFNEDVYFKVFHNDVLLNDDSMIATGDILKVVSADGNETYKEYRLAVTGDVDGNGLANHFDYEIIVAVSTCMQLLEIPYNIAADMNFDGSVDGFDAIELDLFINNMESSITINNVSMNQVNYIVNNTMLLFYDPKRFVHVNKI